MLSYVRSNRHGGSPLRLSPTIDNQIWHVGGQEQAEFIEALIFATVQAPFESPPLHVNELC